MYAKGTEWVKSVKNELVVRDGSDTTIAQTETSVDDASITSQVKFELLKHKSTSAIKTKVTTENGIVRISGNAANDSEKALVTKLTSDIRGVKSVVNNMTVNNIVTSRN